MGRGDLTALLHRSDCACARAIPRPESPSIKGRLASADDGRATLEAATAENILEQVHRGDAGNVTRLKGIGPRGGGRHHNAPLLLIAISAGRLLCADRRG